MTLPLDIELLNSVFGAKLHLGLTDEFDLFFARRTQVGGNLLLDCEASDRRKTIRPVDTPHGLTS